MLYFGNLDPHMEFRIHQYFDQKLVLAAADNVVNFGLIISIFGVIISNGTLYVASTSDPPKELDSLKNNLGNPVPVLSVMSVPWTCQL